MSSIEPVLRQYAAAFDGTPKPFPSDLFDSLFSPTFHITKEEFNQDWGLKLENKYIMENIDREQVRKTHEEYMAAGTSLTLVHCNVIGLNSIDAEFLLKNANEETKVRMVFTTRDKQIVHGRTVDSTTSVLRARHEATFSMFGTLVKKLGITESPAESGAAMNTYHGSKVMPSEKTEDPFANATEGQ